LSRTVSRPPSRRRPTVCHRRGFPHSEIPGSKVACTSPGRIAAGRVFHRLLPPRHPPCALRSLAASLNPHCASNLVLQLDTTSVFVRRLTSLFVCQRPVSNPETRR